VSQDAWIGVWTIRIAGQRSCSRASVLGPRWLLPLSTTQNTRRALAYGSCAMTCSTDPNQWSSLAALEAALLAFGERYSAIATPFEWRFTRADLRRVLAALAAQTAAA